MYRPAVFFHDQRNPIYGQLLNIQLGIFYPRQGNVTIRKT